MYYARIDWTTSVDHPGWGFANTKKAICFANREDRNQYVVARKEWDYTCKAINRREAMKMLEAGPEGKGLAMYNPETKDLSQFIVFRTPSFSIRKRGKIYNI